MRGATSSGPLVVSLPLTLWRTDTRVRRGRPSPSARGARKSSSATRRAERSPRGTSTSSPTGPWARADSRTLSASCRAASCMSCGGPGGDHRSRRYAALFLFSADHAATRRRRSSSRHIATDQNVLVFLALPGPAMPHPASLIRRWPILPALAQGEYVRCPAMTRRPSRTRGYRIFGAARQPTLWFVIRIITFFLDGRYILRDNVPHTTRYGRAGYTGSRGLAASPRAGRAQGKPKGRSGASPRPR